MIRSDFHIHTHNSCDCTKIGRSMEERIEELKAAGITDFGFSDHVHTFYNYPREIAASRREFDETLARHPELKGHMHFGIELSVMSEWEIDMIEHERIAEDSVPFQTFTYGLRWSDGPFNATPGMAINDYIRKQYGIEYVVAGVHWALFCYGDDKAVWDSYRRQYLTAIAHPHTDILAHWLWWWNEPAYIKGTQNPFYDFKKVPETFKDEIAWALKTYDTAFEVQPFFCVPRSFLAPDFHKEYMEYAAKLQDMGIRLTFGSDAHGAYQKPEDIAYVGRQMETAGIDTSKLYDFSERKPFYAEK
ncbi:MAG: hypothetical protein KIG36_00240 [Eubacteriales bacterium]|nr:hypothetical protein [Eubacteriales bacterium]